MDYKKIKKFGDKKIVIRKLSSKDLKQAKKFKIFINRLIKEDAKVLMDKEIALKYERNWLKERLKEIKNHQEVHIFAEFENDIIASTAIGLGKFRNNHIGELGISIKKEYRGIGLGTYLIKEIIKLAEKELKPKPKIIRLGVFINNKPAINLYKKVGFKKVAQIPDQIQYKGKLVDEVVMLLYL